MYVTVDLKSSEEPARPAETKGVNVEQEEPEEDFSHPEDPDEELNLSEVIDITVNTKSSQIPDGAY